MLNFRICNTILLFTKLNTHANLNNSKSFICNITSHDCDFIDFKVYRALILAQCICSTVLQGSKEMVIILAITQEGLFCTLTLLDPH